jgi:inhibitor of cysteine peptidase
MREHHLNSKIIFIQLLCLLLLSFNASALFAWHHFGHPYHQSAHHPIAVPVSTVERTLMPRTELIHLGRRKTSFTLRLPSNPTTGFSWQLAKIDPQALFLRKSHYIPNPSSRMIGAPGIQEWEFGLQPFFYERKHGRTLLVFVYQRPWEKTAVKQRSFLIER